MVFGIINPMMKSIFTKQKISCNFITGIYRSYINIEFLYPYFFN